MSHCFPTLYQRSSGNVKVELDPFNHAIKAYLKGQQMLIHLLQQQKSDLASLNAQIDKKDADKLKTVSAD